MTKNVGSIDRILRILAGIVLLAWGFLPLLTGGEIIWWGAIGIVPLFTGLINWCPAYSLFGLNTCKVDTK